MTPAGVSTIDSRRQRRSSLAITDRAADRDRREGPQDARELRANEDKENGQR